MISLDDAKKIKCSGCNFNGKCPLGNSRDFCSAYFIMFMYNNVFSSEELSDIKELCTWRSIYKNDKSLKNECSVFSIALSKQYLNSKLENPKSIVIYTLANAILNECNSSDKKSVIKEINKYNDPSIIKPIVPWFGAKKSLEKKIVKNSIDVKNAQLSENNQR